MYNFYPKKLVQPPGCAPNILLIMKLTTLIFVTAILQVSATTYAQKITLSEKNTPLDKVFEKISDQTGYDFIISSENLNLSKVVTINVKNEDLKTTLNQIFTAQPLTFLIQEKLVVVSGKEMIVTSKVHDIVTLPINLSGKVTDSLGIPLPGATIKIKGTDKIFLTDSNGRFTVTANEGDILIFSFVGYDSYSYIVGQGDNLAIKLHSSSSKLNEIQVIGYGTTTKRLNTGNVATITSKDIELQPVTNVLSAVSGRVAGLTVQTTNGLPGGGINIQVRGQNSIGSTPGTYTPNHPLFIIDGVPFSPDVITSASVLSGNSLNGTISPFNSMNPDDIESISILKDADATAIYGSRGANGVVLITTKKGKAGKSTTNISVSEGINRIANLPKLLNLKQYLQIRREAFKNVGRVPSADPTSSNYAPDLMVWDTTRSTDWAKYMLGGTGHVTDAQGNISGGNAQTTFYVGGNYHSETTVLPGDNLYQRAGMHMSLQHVSLNNKFHALFSSSYSWDNNRLSNPVSSFAFDINLAPNYPLYDASGKYNWYTDNPAARLLSVSRSQTENIVTNAVLSYTIIPGLNVKSSFGFNKININQVITFPTASLYPGNTNFSNFGNTSNQSFIAEPQIDYTKNFKSSTLSALIGGTYQITGAKGQVIQASNFSSESLLQNISSAGSLIASNDNSQYKYASIFGRITYNIDQKYILNVSSRRDGSSKFGPGNQFGNFGAIGGAWLFSNENWIKQSVPLLSYGKLRASYGITGNDQISDYQYLSTYGSSGYIYQDTSALQPSRIANAQFRWETNKKLEFALELGLIKDRILLTVSHFSNKSSNQLVSYTIPRLTGFSSYQANLPAVVENSGWEFELNTKNVQKKNFSWSTNFNLTIPKNVLKAFSNLSTSSYAKTLVVGEDVTRVYGYKFVKVDSIGRPVYATAAGGTTLTPSSTTDAYFTLGKRTPDFYGGIGNTISYKRLQLDIFGQFVKQASMGGLVYTPGRALNNYYFIINRWQQPGDQTHVPKSSTTNNSAYKSSSANYFDASYFRLKNVSLSYDFSGGWLKMEHFKIYVLTENLLTFWNKNAALYDPESGAFSAAVPNIPPMKSFVIGAKLTL